MATKGVKERFHQAVLDAYNRHGFTSLRQAERITGVNYSAIHGLLSRGNVPSRGQVIEWAEGLREPINHWLELAGYDPVPTELVTSSDEDEGTIDPAESIRIALRKNRPELSERTVEDILSFARERIAEDDKFKQ